MLRIGYKRNSLLLVCLLSTLFSSAAFSQVKLQDLAVSELKISYYTSKDFFDQLDLSAEQRQKIAPISRDVQQWLGADQYMELPSKEAKRIRSEFRSQIEKVLSKPQQLRMRQYMTAKYFEMFTLKDSHGLPQNYIHLKAPPWFEDRVSEFIGLSGKQQMLVLERTRIYLQNTDSVAQENKNTENNFFADWQKQLFNQLSAKEQKLYQEALGPSFQFPKSCKCIFYIADSRGHLFLLSDMRIIYDETRNGGGKKFFLANLESRIGGNYQVDGLLWLLEQKDVVNSLDLNEQQLAKFDGLQKKWYQQHPFHGVVSIQNDFGTGLLKNKGEANRKKISKEEKVFIKKVVKVLLPIQRKRLRQIWNQMVLHFGWRLVPLAHPDWCRFLKLDRKTQNACHKTNEKMRADYKKLLMRFSQQKNVNLQKLYLNLSEILDEQQKEKAKELFGPYWNGQGLVE